MKPRHSSTALGLPGRLTIRLRLWMPAAARLSMALGVIFRDMARMASGMPGASFSQTSRVASGVTSLGEKPVPPVVRIRAIPRSANSRILAASSSFSSGSRARWTLA